MNTTLTLTGPAPNLAALADEIHDHLMVSDDGLTLSLAHLIPDNTTVGITFFARYPDRVVLGMDTYIPDIGQLMANEYANILTFVD